MRPDPAAKDARDTNRSTALRALQERDQEHRRANMLSSKLGDAEHKLAAVDALHQPADDLLRACACGVTWPCPTRRELDR